MRRKFFVCLGTLAFASVLMFYVSLKGKAQSNNSLSLSLLVNELQAGESGCTTTPGSNSGSCEKNVNGTEWNCVSAGFWDSKDCSGD